MHQYVHLLFCLVLPVCPVAIIQINGVIDRLRMNNNVNIYNAMIKID